ncbi:helix-turn-helix transcriptional regulator [Endozoicomonas ascidiicola]|uniref:helix-turn-helix transcriptional regulator n=1 Tax=Endozoicomonas ascidiicola TaxID=1698521 RepID=UPI00082F7EA0|nr:AlpA family phage regulatory protein [Endozoicomonas ascidiicola]
MEFDNLISMKEIKKMTSLSATSIYRMIDEGCFPEGRMHKGRRIWRFSDVAAAVERMWNDAK